jgi:hypothetical protein
LHELKRSGTINASKSRARATAGRHFVSALVIKGLIADGLVTVKDTKGGRVITATTKPDLVDAPVEAPEAPVEASPEPTPTEAPAEPAPVTTAPAPSTEAPLGRRLVALYMRKDGRIIVEIDPAGIPE